MVPESLLDAKVLAELLNGLLAKREQLIKMASAARTVAWSAADERIADVCIEAAA
jgi:UDP-N-acetylglucosamine--N-acetylmuramyl-(pentapeptide) pyrophosphoryl-undecaprenol N-acetylglucosamine transferase